MDSDDPDFHKPKKAAPQKPIPKSKAIKGIKGIKSIKDVKKFVKMNKPPLNNILNDIKAGKLAGPKKSNAGLISPHSSSSDKSSSDSDYNSEKKLASSDEEKCAEDSWESTSQNMYDTPDSHSSGTSSEDSGTLGHSKVLPSFASKKEKDKDSSILVMKQHHTDKKMDIVPAHSASIYSSDSYDS